MKEVPCYSGIFKNDCKMAYVEQEPYIFSGTVRDNILFGSSFKPTFYDKVVETCCLLPDLVIKKFLYIKIIYNYYNFFYIFI